MSDLPPTDRILTAEVLSIGSELLVGETRDTNAGELAASLTTAGVRVERITAVPDRLEVVTDAFATGLRRAGLVVSTGGLGPTPDDLTREAIAGVCGETPSVDPDLERWLRDLWARRSLPFPESNRKQAWLIPSAHAMPNPNGTAPGWFVTPPSGGVIVAMPGPPREMRPMWEDHARPRLHALGLGADVAARTYRLTGIGESQVAEILGDALLRRANPEVATYARAEAVDVRVSAVADHGVSAADLVSETAAIVEERLGRFVWATGATTWSQALGARLADLGWRVAITETGTHGQVAAVLGDVDWIALDEIHGTSSANGGQPSDDALLAEARRVRTASGAELGVAVHAHERERERDTIVTVAIVTPAGEVVERRTAFLGGSLGRTRAALAVAAALLTSIHKDG